MISTFPAHSHPCRNVLLGTDPEVKMIRKADIVLFILLVLLGGALAFPALFMSSGGDTVKVTVNGKLYGTYKLSEDKEITISKSGHINKFRIKDGTVDMIKASCKNQICVHEAKISRSGQSIVCLPNRVSIVIEGKGGDDYDTVSGK